MKRLFKELRRTLRAMRSGNYESMRGGIDFNNLSLWKDGEFVTIFSRVMKTL
ncbi:MAG: hypothetical protein HW401_699 [Parcubacteria group bacterium]|nr:hypothetical protein [Parcubacteria group bacterium]